MLLNRDSLSLAERINFSFADNWALKDSIVTCSFVSAVCLHVFFEVFDDQNYEIFLVKIFICGMISENKIE